jgi:hypothetical protein
VEQSLFWVQPEHESVVELHTGVVEEQSYAEAQPPHPHEYWMYIRLKEPEHGSPNVADGVPCAVAFSAMMLHDFLPTQRFEMKVAFVSVPPAVSDGFAASQTVDVPGTSPTVNDPHDPFGRP